MKKVFHEKNPPRFILRPRSKEKNEFKQEFYNVFYSVRELFRFFSQKNYISSSLSVLFCFS